MSEASERFERHMREHFRCDCHNNDWQDHYAEQELLGQVGEAAREPEQRERLGVWRKMQGDTA